MWCAFTQRQLRLGENKVRDTIAWFLHNQIHAGLKDSQMNKEHIFVVNCLESFNQSCARKHDDTPRHFNLIRVFDRWKEGWKIKGEIIQKILSNNVWRRKEVSAEVRMELTVGLWVGF